MLAVDQPITGRIKSLDIKSSQCPHLLIRTAYFPTIGKTLYVLSALEFGVELIVSVIGRGAHLHDIYVSHLAPVDTY
jgi:hypothetical protein